MSTIYLIVRQLLRLFVPGDQGKLLDYYDVPNGRYHSFETDEGRLEAIIRYTRK